MARLIRRAGAPWLMSGSGLGRRRAGGRAAVEDRNEVHVGGCAEPYEMDRSDMRLEDGPLAAEDAETELAKGATTMVGLGRRLRRSFLVRNRHAFDVHRGGPCDGSVTVWEAVARRRRTPEGRAKLRQQSDTDDQRCEQTIAQDKLEKICRRVMATVAS
jgi:hypothetical protein